MEMVEKELLNDLEEENRIHIEKLLAWKDFHLANNNEYLANKMNNEIKKYLNNWKVFY